MAVIDCMMYNGERDMLDLHLNVLNSKVDRFIIVEAKTTFSGRTKPLYFMNHEQFFKRFWRKIDYFIIDENYTQEERKLAESSPNTQGASHWKNEFLQKESIKKALTKLADDDLLFIGDVDEIWNPELIYPEEPQKLKLRVYAYYMNNLSNEQFWGTLVSSYANIKNQCLNHMRTTTHKIDKYAGWHFTSMGGEREVRRKLNDSYTEESYNTSIVQNLLADRVKEGTDYLGRGFTFRADERLWPLYLKQNRIRYKHLCR